MRAIRTGSVASRVVEHLQQPGAPVSLTAREISALFGGFPEKDLTNRIRPAIERGALVREREGKRYRYRLSPMSPIAWIVKHACGTAQIPADAAPRSIPEAPKPGPKCKPKVAPTLTPREKLIAALDDEWRSVWDMHIRAQLSTGSAYAHLPALVTTGVAEAREVPWRKGWKLEYRRVG